MDNLILTDDPTIEYKKVLWRCRRGMLELDLILMPFAKKHFQSLSSEQQQQFIELLKQDDPHIFGWLMGHEAVSIPSLEGIVEIIKQRHAS